MTKPLLIIMSPSGEVLATIPAPAGVVVKQSITKVVEKLDDLWTGRVTGSRPAPRTVRINGEDWDISWLN